MLNDEAMTMEIKEAVSHSSFVNNRFLRHSRHFRRQKVDTENDRLARCLNEGNAEGFT